MSVVHVAIIDARMAEGLVDGRKRVESRFSRQRRLPYGRVSLGDRIYFKIAGGNVIGRSSVTRVREFDDLTPEAIASLRRRYNGTILAPATYWRTHRHCRYGVLIWLGGLVRCPPRISVPRQYGNGWVVLCEPAP